MPSDSEDKAFGSVASRNEDFVDKVKTKIWLEESSADNPYVARSASCYGYELMDLIDGASYSDMIFLLLRGELPAEQESDLFRCLLIAFINPGPRDHGSRAAIQASVGKTDSLHILPIAMAVFSGQHSGASNIEQTVRFFAKSARSSDDECIAKIESTDAPELLGFGTKFGGKDELAAQLLARLARSPGSGASLKLASRLNTQLSGSKIGILAHGVVAAAFCDLGFLPRQAPAILQLISAPGILAHGLEYVGKPRTAVPFLSDERYEIVAEGDNV